MQDDDLVDIHKINPRILIDIRYATENNFTGKPVYSSAKCYLRRKVAMKLDAVQRQLEKVGLGLKVFDGYRPISVEKVFSEKSSQGSYHNRGTAVGLTLVDKQGKELKMPTRFDDFSSKAHRDFERLPKEVILNRSLLENVMTEHGFIPVAAKWWHFDDNEGERYPIEDIPFEGLEK